MDENIKAYLIKFGLSSYLTDDEIRHSLPFFKTAVLGKRDFLSREGTICTRICIVTKGILRSYYVKDGEQLTTYFNTEGTVATALRSYLKVVPAHENIQALTEVEMLVIEKKDLNQLFEDIPSWNKLARIVMEQLYVKMEERSISLQYDTAKERYLKFLKDFPGIIQIIPLQYIASFVGITPETLSRIRKSLLES